MNGPINISLERVQVEVEIVRSERRVPMVYEHLQSVTRQYPATYSAQHSLNLINCRQPGPAGVGLCPSDATRKPGYNTITGITYGVSANIPFQLKIFSL